MKYISITDKHPGTDCIEVPDTASIDDLRGLFKQLRSPILWNNAISIGDTVSTLEKALLKFEGSDK